RAVERLDVLHPRGPRGAAGRLPALLRERPGADLRAAGGHRALPAAAGEAHPAPPALGVRPRGLVLPGRGGDADLHAPAPPGRGMGGTSRGRGPDGHAAPDPLRGRAGHGAAQRALRQDDGEDPRPRARAAGGHHRGSTADRSPHGARHARLSDARSPGHGARPAAPYRPPRDLALERGGNPPPDGPSTGPSDQAGHSKWATTKHKKAVIDARRGKLFAKLVKNIEVAARMGGPDPAGNPTLYDAIQKAKKTSVPNDNIDRAVKRGGGLGGEGVGYGTLVYGGYAPGGVAVLVECLTDNKNRAVSEVRLAFNRNGGNMADSGSVAYLFERKGVVGVPKGEHSEDDLLEVVLEAGAEEIDDEGETFEIISEATDVVA